VRSSVPSRESLEASRPFFTTRENLDDLTSLSSVHIASGDLSIGRYRRDRPGHGVSTPNPVSPAIMAVVILRPRPPHLGWRNGRTIEIPAFGTGTLTCLDLWVQWTMDLSAPFDSFHAFIPMAAFDEVAVNLRRPRIERLDRPTDVEHRDSTMLALAQALNPLLGRPGEATALFTDYVFSAMVVHLATNYGGLDPRELDARDLLRGGMLTPFQERVVTSRLLDDLRGNPGLDELAALCGLSRGHFARAFKRTLGMPPHRWLLARRIDRAKHLLRHTNMPISEIALDCGFADQSHLTRVFSGFFNIGPAAWRRENQS
jgi:AraC family transcriptional regulator